MESKIEPSGLPLRVGMVAGETSGDYLGFELLRKIRLIASPRKLIAEGIGGSQMIREGFRSLHPMERLSVIGFVDLLVRSFELFRIRAKTLAYFRKVPPDIFIGIDAPSFNLRVEQELHHLGVATVHYVSPSVWACRCYRIRRMRRAIDLLLVLYPFEVGFYAQHGMHAALVGHPLAGKIPLRPDRGAARSILQIPKEATILAILPGSRAHELKRHSKPFIQAALRCKERYPELVFISSVVDEAARVRFLSAWNVLAAGHPIHVSIANTHQVLIAADVALVASGTVSLEAMLAKTPMVVGYRLPFLSELIYRATCKSKFISLPNLLAKRMLVPERVQRNCTPESLSRALLYWLDQPAAREELVNDFLALHHTLLPKSDEEIQDILRSFFKSRALL